MLMPKGARYFSIMGNLDWVFKRIENHRLLPVYDSSVEVCCGAGELIWNTKPPKGKEIMNDIDSDIIRMHTIVKNLTEKQLRKLSGKYSWKLDKDHFEFLRDNYEPKNDLDFLYRRLYLYSARKRASDVDHDYFLLNFQGMTKNPTKRLWDAHLRLQNVTLINDDALNTIKLLEDEPVFFFLDPPYPAKDRYYSQCSLDWNKLYKIVSNLEQKWMLVSSYKHTQDNLNELKMSVDGFIHAKRSMKKFIDNFNFIKVTERACFAGLFKKCNFPDKEYFIVWNYDTNKLRNWIN